MRTLLGLLLACVVAASVTARASVTPDLLVSSRFSNQVLRYDGQTGAFRGVFASGNGLANPNGIAYGPDGHLYVGLGDVGVVKRFHGQTGAFLGDVVTGGTGGLIGCRAIRFGPDGHLYVNNGAGNNVLRYNGTTGAFLGVAASHPSMVGPVGLTFGPSGNMYVGAALSNGVYEFAPSGALVRVLTTGTAHRQATGVRFDAAGVLYSAQSVTNEVITYDAASGSFSGVFIGPGAGLAVPIDLIFTPEGDLLVGSFTTNSVSRYSSTGAFLGVFITSGSGGLSGTHNFAYMPAPSAFTAGVLLLMLRRRHRAS